MNTVWLPMGHKRWVMLSMSCWWLPCGKSVRPMLPANSTSPTNARSICGAWNTTCPGVWPGQWRTFRVSLPLCPLARAARVVDVGVGEPDLFEREVKTFYFSEQHLQVAAGVDHGGFVGGVAPDEGAVLLERGDGDGEVVEHGG